MRDRNHKSTEFNNSPNRLEDGEFSYCSSAIKNFYDSLLIKKTKNSIKITGNILAKILSFSAYWIFALFPKKKNLWVFSGFQRRNYIDNTKYLYEYIVKNHTEIQAVWLTGSKEIRKNLKENNMPVLKMNTLKGILTMARASVAISDHYRMSDYKNICGYNARTKFVNIWHGVGLKDMRPLNSKLKNTTLKGVQLSNDIIISKKDNILIKLVKLVKYPFIAPFRELFEKYYMIVCPGEQFKEYSAKPWSIPEKAQFLCGYPRNEMLYGDNKKFDKYKILYAPTYRWEVEDEQKLVNNFITNISLINDFLEKIDGEMVLRLHPHTWRNYEITILSNIKDYPRISISKEKDIYKELGLYSVLISDYSSIVYDFLITQKPIILLASDYKEYCTNDYNFQMDYKEYSPGDITYSWQETINSIKKSIENPDYNKELRNKISKIFTPSEYNNINNSKLIVEEIKKRLSSKTKG